MNFVLYASVVIIAVYLALLSWMAAGFIRTRVFRVKRSIGPIPLTIIVCARNEAGNIGPFLQTLLLQDYPMDLVELILVNDHSSDNTLPEAEKVLYHSRLPYRIISNKVRKGKKESITSAMKLARPGLIILRDADTFAGSKNWLRSIAAFYQHTSADLIIAPVRINGSGGLLTTLQDTENLVLNLFTGGSAFYGKAFLCNGANLAFSKSVFERVGGFSSNSHLEGGDDIFFLEDVKRLPGARIRYLKSADATIKTYPLKNLKKLVAQRARWAAKFKHNHNALNLVSAALIFLANLLWIFWLVASFISENFKIHFIMLVLFKLTIDLLLLLLAQGIFKEKRTGLLALPVALLYPLYACTVALISVPSQARWKN